VADDGHLGTVHPQGDALPGEFVADVQLPAARPTPLTRRSTSTAVLAPAGSGGGPAGRAPSAANRDRTRSVRFVGSCVQEVAFPVDGGFSFFVA
jgi:hypothetical protein